MRSQRSSRQIPGAVRSSRDVPGGHRIAIELVGGAERVPGLLLLPDPTHEGQTRSAGVVLLHGFTSRKERMAEGLGRALLGHGMASLAIDLPLHGEREGSLDALSMRNPLALVKAWRLALDEIRQALDYLGEMSSVDATRLSLVGYSLGAFLAVSAAADDSRVRAVVLAAGGDLPEQTPFSALVRAIADPLSAVRKLAGRPLLMVHGRYDRTVRPAQAERLFMAAGEPKELYWYEGGHWPAPAAIEYAARWLAGRSGKR